MAPSLLGGWIWGTRALPITINCRQSWLVLANQRQSQANPVPIRFQSRANQMPIHGNSLNQSRINLIHFLPIQANPILIQCQSDANPRSIFLWIFANPCQSMPILANPMPISGQSVTSYVLNHRTSCLYGMVPSLLGGWNWALPIIINSSQSWPVLAAQCQSWPIQCQFKANQLSIFHPSQ